MITNKKVTHDSFFGLTTLLFCGLLLFSPSAVFSAEISDYTDCANVGRSDSNSDVPLTKAERIAILQADYVRTVSLTERCEKNEQSGSSASSGGASSAGAASGIGAASGGAGATQTMSQNAGVIGDAIKVNSSLQSSVSTPPGAMVGNDSGYATSGREHEKLEKADNKAVLRTQIKAAADKETDPEMKKILMEKYESLK